MCCAGCTQASASQIGGAVGKALQKASERGGRAAVSVYDTTQLPEVSLEAYLARWVEATGCGAEVLLVAVAYIDRVCERTGLHPTRHNIHRLALASLVVATKWLSDAAPTNPTLAFVGGVSTSELARLERTLLNDLAWEADVSTPLFNAYLSRFCKRACKNGGKERRY